MDILKLENISETKNISCPYCGAETVVVLDLTLGAQEYVEDCQICCSPIALQYTINEDGYVDLQSSCDQ